MNMEISRTHLTRIGLVGVVIGAANYMFVRPQASAAQDAQIKYKMQSEFIEQGEQSIELYQDDVDEMVEMVRSARDAMLMDLKPDIQVTDQQLLQRKATLHGMTVTRLEPSRAVNVSTDTEVEEDSVELEIKEFRIECRGNYSGFVSFIDDLQNEKRRMKVTSFRLVPTDEQVVRANLTVKLVELVEFPESIKTAFTQPEAQGSEQVGADKEDEE
jgi:gas vesicle protein